MFTTSFHYLDREKEVESGQVDEIFINKFDIFDKLFL